MAATVYVAAGSIDTESIISFKSSQSGVRAGVCRMICIHPCALSSSPSEAPPVLARDSTDCSCWDSFSEM